MNIPKEQIDNYQPNRVEMIIALLEQRMGDVKAVAKETGFANHREMAAYLRTKGYIWNREKNKYILTSEDRGIELLRKNALSEETAPNDEVCAGTADIIELEKYLPLLELLHNHQDKLANLLNGDGHNPPTTNYPMQGDFITITVPIAALLEQLIRELSRKRGIDRQEIIQTALVEFFQRHGYGREINRVLER